MLRPAASRLSAAWHRLSDIQGHHFMRTWRTLFLALAVLPFVANATIPAPVTLKKLFAKAEQVLLVQVVERRILGVGENSCGASYTGAIERSFKGAPKGARVEFGPSYQLNLGAYYLVFLSKSSEPFERYISTNDRHLTARVEFLKRCKDEMAPFAMMLFGFGAMVVDDVGTDLDQWVVNWQTIVTLPKSAKVEETRTDTLVTIGEITKVLQQENR
jgi:hypothetical protein